MTPGERLGRRLKARKAQKALKFPKAEWWATMPTEEEPVSDPEPVTYPFVAYDWYEFCVCRYEEYQSRGMDTAGQMYWAMRWWGNKDPDDLTTEAGFEENMATYWEYKLETVPHMFDHWEED